MAESSGIYELCSDNTDSHASTIQSNGYFKSAAYPLSLYGSINCRRTYRLPETCRMLYIEFIDFYTFKNNILMIDGHQYTSELTGLSLYTATTHQVTVGVWFQYPHKVYQQRILLKYSCSE